MGWLVYELQKDGTPFYVGVTCNRVRRLKEHRTLWGSAITMVDLQHYSDEAQARAGEILWINKRWDDGFRLKNRMRHVSAKGTLTHGPATRAKLSAAGKGKPKPPGFGAKLSAATTGKPHKVSDAGRAAMSRTQFKKGAGRFADLSPERQEQLRAARRRAWDSIPPDERSRRATERNRAAWDQRTPDERAEIGRRISEALARKRQR